MPHRDQGILLLEHRGQPAEGEESFSVAGNLKEGEGEGNNKPCSGTAGTGASDPTVPTCCALDDSRDGGRNFQELPPSSSFWLANPSGPSSVPQLVRATEGK